MSVEKANKLLEKAESSLVQYHQYAEDGKNMDMMNFENIIHDFCNILQKLPPLDAKKFESSLVQLGGSLQKLSESVTEKRDSLKMQINGMDTQQQAKAAYSKYSSLNDNK